MLVAAVAVGFIAIVLAGIYATRIPIAMWVADEILADTPFENATFRLVVLDEDHLVLEELEADHPFAVRATRVSVTYDPLAALDGTIESITVAGLDATLSPDQLADITPSDSSTGDPPVTIGRLTIADSVVTVVLDERQVRFEVDGEIDNLDPLSGMLDVAVAGPDFRFDGPIAVAATDDGGGQTVTWRIDGGNIQRDELTIAAVTGQVLVARPNKDGATLTVDVSLASPRAVFSPYDTGPFDLDLSATLDLLDAPVIETAAARLELGAASEPIHVRLAADLSDMAVLSTTLNVDIGRDLVIATGPDLTISAPSSLTSHAEAALPDTWLADIDGLPDLALGLLTSFSATLDSAGINIDGYASASSAFGNVTLRPNGNETAIEIGPETAVSGLVIDPDWLSSWGLSEDSAAALQTPVDVAIVTFDEPLQLRNLSGGGYAIDGKTGLSLAQAERSATLWLDGKAQISGTAALESALLRDGAATVTATSLASMEDVAFAAKGRAEYSEDVWRAEVEIDGSASRAVADDMRIDDLGVAIPADVTWSGQTFELTAIPVVLASASAAHVGDWRSGPVELDLPLRVAGSLEKFSIYLDDNGWVDLAGLTHPRLVIDQPASIKLEQMGLPVLTLEFDDDGFPVWDARLKVAPPSSMVTILDDGGLPAAVVSGTLPTMSVHATQLIASYLTATLETNGGSLTWVDQEIAATGLKTLVTYNTGLSPWPQLHLEIDTIDDLATPKRFATLSSDIRIAPVWPQGNDVRLSLNVHAPDRRYAVNVEASYEPEKDLASALVRMPGVTFEPDGYQPGNLSPMLAPYTQDVSGTVDLTGDVTWQAGRVVERSEPGFSRDLRHRLRRAYRAVEQPHHVRRHRTAVDAAWSTRGDRRHRRGPAAARRADQLVARPRRRTASGKRGHEVCRRRGHRRSFGVASRKRPRTA